MKAESSTEREPSCAPTSRRIRVEPDVGEVPKHARLLMAPVHDVVDPLAARGATAREEDLRRIANNGHRQIVQEVAALSA